MAYISRSCDLPKKEIFDGLHKRLKNGFGKNYQKRKLYARNSGKILKNTEKIPTGLESPQNSK